MSDPIEDVLPLSPLQQGMLFHATYDDGAHDVYTAQVVFALRGPVDAARLRAAGQALIDRHANLRAAFVHEDVDEPVQVVLRVAELPWSERTLTEDGFAEFLARDRREPFTLDEPPLLRMTLVTLGDERRLVISNHHVLLDGWSLPLLVRELLELYAGGQPPRPRPYRDYLVWLSERDRDAAATAWREAFDGLDAPTLLRPDDDRVPVLPAKLRLELDQALTRRIYAVARENALTVNTVVQGLWGLVLGRLTGRDDVVFGATVAGRPPDLDGVESMIGLFLATVPVRIRLRGSLLDVLRGVQRDQSALIEHQHLGLTGIQRAAGHGDLFDTLVVFESYPVDGEAVAERERAAGIGVSVMAADDATHYPLTLAVDASDRLTIVFEHRPGFDAGPIAARFRAAAEALADDVRVDVARIGLLSPAERADLRAWGTGKDLGAGPLLTAALEEQARRTPDATAIVHAGRTTFGEFNRRANQVARRLIDAGAGPDTIVALVMPAGPDMLTAIAAVFKAGAAYLPVDPDWPDERVEFVLADARPAIVLRELPGTDRVRDEDLPPIAGPEDPAYVIYTSGSTGAPKAVVVPHRAIANLLLSHRTDLFDPARRRAGRPLRVAHAWPMAFDASWQPMLWMFAGHELHLVPPDVRRDADRLRDFLAGHEIEFVELSPSLLAQVASEPGWRGSLRVLGVGGEAVPPAQWRMLRAEPDLVTYNLYGPTECTVDSAACDLARTPNPCIGSPVGNAYAYVLDRTLQPCPQGVEGELYLAGEGLARGYLRQPGITASRFVADPFGDPGTRMYRTGDVARWNAEGLIELLGRVDDQVKIRGFRIEPGEIEAALLADPRVAHAAVVPREDLPGVKRLVAYAVLSQPKDAAAVLEGLRSRLPDHMVPAAIVPLDKLPLTRNDKLDVKALPAPDWTTTSRPPANDRERLIAGLFADVLGLPSVGPDDSFFALGGDSIVSMRLVSKARGAGLRFSPRDVFEHRTVAALARVSTGGTGGERKVDQVGEVPLTPMLRWLAENPPYDRLSQARLLCTPPGLDRDGLIGLVGALLDRHDVLRATFDGERFVVRPAGAVDPAALVRQSDLPAVDLLADVMAEEVARLRPATGEMARFVLFGDDRLLILLHHLVVDGASWGVIVPELADLWAGRELPPTGTSFREWALGLTAAAPARSGEMALWRETLGDPDPLLGARLLDPAVDTRATMRGVRTSLDAPTTHALLTDGMAVDAILLAALATAASRIRGGGTSLLVALEGHGREEQVVPGSDLSGTVGWFTSVYPVRVDPGDLRADPHKAVARVAGQLTLPDRGIGHGLLRYLNEDTRDELASLPEPQIEFNYLGRLTIGERAGEPWSGAPEAGAMGGGVDDGMPFPYCLVLNVLVNGDRLEADWQWPAALFTEDQVRRLSGEWFAALTMIVKETPGE